MINVFIAYPMDGLTNDEIKKRRLELLDMLKRRYPTEEFHLIAIPPYPYSCISPIWVLGKFLEYMAQADLVFFSKDWEIDYMCSLEHAICRYYDIPIAYEDGYFTHESVYYHYDANNSPLSSCMSDDILHERR